MKEILLQLAQYNIWANKRIIEPLLKLDDETLDQEITSSFSSLRKTVYHMWGAEFVWLQRIQLTEQPVWINRDFTGTFAEACHDWQQVSEVIKQLVETKYDDRAFEHVVQYYNSEKKSFKNPLYQMLLQAFNHATYHRGQLVTMLHETGITQIPQTDYIAFLR